MRRMCFDHHAFGDVVVVYLEALINVPFHVILCHFGFGRGAKHLCSIQVCFKLRHVNNK